MFRFQNVSRARTHHIHTYIYINIYIYLYLHIYIYIYTHRHSEQSERSEQEADTLTYQRGLIHHARHRELNSIGRRNLLQVIFCLVLVNFNTYLIIGFSRYSERCDTERKKERNWYFLTHLYEFMLFCWRSVMRWCTEQCSIKHSTPIP